MLSSGQIRAARAFTKMSALELAKLTGLSLTTIQRIENDESLLEKASGVTIRKIREAFENAGVEFIDAVEKDGISGYGVRFFPAKK